MENGAFRSINRAPKGKIKCKKKEFTNKKKEEKLINFLFKNILLPYKPPVARLLFFNNLIDVCLGRNYQR